MKISHLIYKVDNLKKAVESFENYGFCVEYGKREHPYNALIYFNDHTYIELIQNQNAVLGNNGVGKSTFAKCLCGLLPKTKGVLNIHGKKYNDRKRRELCYMVMQDVNHQLFSESVMDDVMLGIKGDEITKKEKAHEILKALDIDEYEDVHPMSLSGGQKQRVAIAGALASHKEILIYDEPTSGLDYTHMIEVANCLQQIAKTGKTQFVITHDPELVAECCDYFIFIDNGKVTDQGEWNKGNIEKIKKYFLKSC